MSIIGGLDHYPGVLERKEGLVDLTVNMWDRPLAQGAILWGSWHFNHLYSPRTNSGMVGATVVANSNARWPMLVSADPPDGIARSPFSATPGIRYGRRRNGIASEVTRGNLRFVLDLNDLPTISGGVRVLPADDQMLYVAINQLRPTLPVSAAGFRQLVVKGAVDTGDLILGPILPIPPAGWWTIAEPTLIITGEAPQLGAGAVAMGAAGTFPTPDPDLQIPNPLHFVLPRPTTSFTIRNDEAAGGETLRVSHGLTQQIYEIPAGGERTFFGAVKEVCLMSANAAALCAFTIEANINLGGAASGP